MNSCGQRILQSVVVAATLIAAEALLGEETYDFDRYTVILDKSPFGPVPGTQSKASQPGFAARYSLVGIVQSNGVSGLVQAILEDKTARMTYFKTEGELIDDVKVVRIDVDPPQGVVIQQGLETATLTFVERGGAAAAPTQAAAAQPAQPDAASPTPGVRRIPFRRPNQ